MGFQNSDPTRSREAGMVLDTEVDEMECKNDIYNYATIF